MTAKRINYRKLAFDHYDQLCAHCGFGIPAVLEVAHLDGDRSHNEIGNLAVLCPNCHRMYDLDLITKETIILMRDRPKIAVWAKLMKDAGAKAAATRRKTQEKLKRKSAGQKAAKTRKRNAVARLRISNDSDL
jgi:predicted restriction endonuclease